MYYIYSQVGQHLLLLILPPPPKKKRKKAQSCQAAYINQMCLMTRPVVLSETLSKRISLPYHANWPRWPIRSRRPQNSGGETMAIDG